jgi:hypothetical protein
LNSKPKDSPDFSFKIPSESEEVYMEKIIHLFEIFKTIFYFNFFGLGKALVGAGKV